MRIGWVWVLFLIALGSRAQVPYGNEWIVPTASYLRVAVTQPGLYRLTATELQKQGVNLDKVLPRSLQLYRRGQPVAIWVEGEKDGRLDVADYLEFYGQPNDGLLDTLLYVSPQAMPHSHYSLYSDTATYFLTWRSLDESATAPSGKRIQLVATFLTPDTATYHRQKILQLFTSEYPAGNIYPLEPGYGYENGYIATPYDVGEGWTGPTRRAGQWDVFRLQTLNPVRDSSALAGVEILFVGRTFGAHQVDVWVGDATKQTRKLGTVQWANYDTKTFKAPLIAGDLSATGELSLAYTPTRAGEAVSASYVQWSYPQQIRMTDTESQKTLYPATAATIFVESKDSLNSYDISDPTQPKQLKVEKSGINQWISPNSSRAILVVKAPLQVSSLRPVAFKSLDPQKINYLIVTHPLVRTPVAGSADPVAEYAAYRASEAGGGYIPLVMNASEVADQFNYGEPGPNGTRRLMRWLHDRGSLRYTFLIGKSRSPQIVRHQANARSEDMVPSAGWPDSDIALGIGLDPANPLVPLVPIGRLNAATSRNVWDYLQKVKQHEAAPVAAPWRKNVLHLSGGKSREELVTFRGFVDDYAARADSSSAAPRFQTLSKLTDEPTERFPVAPLINEGVALMTLFGHSSLNITDIDIGFASNESEGYRNKGRYPAVLVNGCALGNFYFGPTPISTDWILAPDRGAVLFLAHTHNGLSAGMYRYSHWLYDALSDPAFTSRGFGDHMKEGIRRYLSAHTSLSDQVTVQQMNLQGDPAIKIFPATQPDYTWSASPLLISNTRGSKLTAWDDSVVVKAEIANYGRYTAGSLPIRLRRMRGSQLLAEYNIVRPAVPVLGSLRLVVPNSSRQGGNETWELGLDPQNAIPEVDETNNLLTTSLLVEEGGAIALLPVDNAVLNKTEVELVAQLPASRSGGRVLFEWGTSPQFGSTTQRDTVRAGGVVAKRPLALTTTFPQTIYWRVRLVGDPIPAYRAFSYDPASLTPAVPEVLATLAEPYTGQVEEGGPLSAVILFENLTDTPFRDSVRVRVQELWGNSNLEKYLTIPPLSARGSHVYRYTDTSQGKSGAGRVLLYFNSGQLPEQAYWNNLVELTYEILPDQTPPLLDVLVDGRRLSDREAVLPQPKVHIRIYDSNRFHLRSDTTGLRVSLQAVCNQCPVVPISLARARWSPTPSADFRVDLDLPTLAPGTYLLTVNARDTKGNEAAPYQIRFRITDKNQVLATTVSPNPADQWVKFSLELEGTSAPASWQVKVYDLQGKLITTLQKVPTLGTNELFWIPSGSSAGVYVYRMQLEGSGWPPTELRTGKILFVR